MLFNVAQSFGVVDYAHDGSEPDYVSMIQLFNRFMIDHIVPEAGSLSNPLLLQPQRPAKMVLYLHPLHNYWGSNLQVLVHVALVGQLRTSKDLAISLT
jgi:hypothetical protein